MGRMGSLEVLLSGQNSDGVTVAVIVWKLLVIPARVVWLAEGSVAVQGFLVDLGSIVVSQRLSMLW